MLAIVGLVSLILANCGATLLALQVGGGWFAKNVRPR
jgi:hypothetical protein